MNRSYFTKAEGMEELGRVRRQKPTDFSKKILFSSSLPSIRLSSSFVCMQMGRVKRERGQKDAWENIHVME